MNACEKSLVVASLINILANFEFVMSGKWWTPFKAHPAGLPKLLP